MAIHVKKGDEVEVMCGNNKGTIGKVLRVIPDKGKAIVQGVNIAKKHIRPTQQNPQGGRISIEKPIDLSNLLPVSPKTSRGSRVRFEIDAKGNKKRVAVDGGEIGTVKKAKK